MSKVEIVWESEKDPSQKTILRVRYNFVILVDEKNLFENQIYISEFFNRIET